MAPRELTAKQKLFCASYLGAANGNATEAARLAGYSGNSKTLQVIGSENLSKPLIKARIAKTTNKLIERHISIKQNRIDALNDRWLGMQRLVEARANDPETIKGPGGDTGMVVHTVKTIGTGDRQKTVNEYTFDAALQREIRETERQAAQELGQWTEKFSVSGVLSFADLHKIADAESSENDPRPGE